MSIVCFPLDAVSSSPTYTGEMLRDTLGVFAASPSNRPIGAFSGVIPGAPTSGIVTASSSTWTVSPFKAVLDLEASASAGPYLVAVATTQTGTMSAANAYARVDILSLTLSDPAEGDGTTTPGLVITYTVGSSSGLPPATPARSFTFAQISVPASGGGAPSVAWVAPFTVAAGGITPVAAGVRPSNPVQGQYIDDATAGLLRWNGTAWVSDVTALQPTCVAYATSSQSVSNAGTLISFGGTVQNDGSMWTSGTNVVIGVAGTYEIFGKITLNGTTWTAGKYVEVETQVNGTGVEVGVTYPPGATLSGVTCSAPPAIRRLNAGDVVTLLGLQTLTAGSFTIATGSLNTSLTVRRVGA